MEAVPVIGDRAARRRSAAAVGPLPPAIGLVVRRLPPAIVVPLIAAIAFWLGWYVLGFVFANGLFGNLVITDTPVYTEMGDRMAAGLLPYRDFAMEYPPAALPIFLLPSLLTPSVGNVADYTRIFEWLIFFCGVASAALTARTLQLLGASPMRLAGAIVLLALSPIFVGPVVLSHFDLWPAALLSGALLAIVARHERVGAGLLGVAVMAKIYPIVLVPLLVAYVWRRKGRREGLVVLGVVLGVMTAILAPFALLGPGGVADALARQATRPLQVESLGAATLMVLHSLTGLPVTVETSAGSQNLVGTLPDLLSFLETAALGVVLLAIWAWFARGSATPQRFVQAGVAAVIAYLALGKVLSPQYLAWLIPLVPLLGGRRGLLAAILVSLAYLLTEAYFPSRYFPYVQDLDAGAARLVLARDLSLVALLAVATLPLRRIWVGSRAWLAWAREKADVIAAHPVQVLVILLVGFFVLRMLWITKPDNSLIFDESYYVNAARVIDGIPVPAGQPYADAPPHVDPNTEHPPLGKAVIAASIRVLGDNGFGWRLPSVVAAMVALAAVYGIVIAAGESAWLALLAVAILGLDNLTFVHGRIGTLDMMATAAILVGAWLALRKRPILAGAAFGIGSLVKVTSFFGYLAFVLVEALRLYRRYRRGGTISFRQLRPLAFCSAAYGIVGLLGLAALDRLFTTFATPIDHLKQMLGYGIALTGGPQPQSIASNPWDWLVGAGSFDYLRVDVSVLVNGQPQSTFPTVEFQGAFNPILIGAAPLVGLFGIWLAIRGRHRLATWAVLWIAANYLPYYALAIVSHRITYLYYALPAVPALAILTAIFLLRAGLPRFLPWGYLAASVVGFIAYFPFRQIPT